MNFSIWQAIVVHCNVIFTPSYAIWLAFKKYFPSDCSSHSIEEWATAKINITTDPYRDGTTTTWWYLQMTKSRFLVSFVTTVVIGIFRLVFVVVVGDYFRSVVLSLFCSSFLLLFSFFVVVVVAIVMFCFRFFSFLVFVFAVTRIILFS